PCRVRIIDSRADLIATPLPENCQFELHADPVDAVSTLTSDVWVVIFTHDHSLDFRLCSALLKRDCHRYLGLIGSKTKALRFRKRLADAGFNSLAIEQMHSPVGLPEVKGKLPMEVAVSIAAQLQSLYYAEQRPVTAQSSSWREIKGVLQAS